MAMEVDACDGGFDDDDKVHLPLRLFSFPQLPAPRSAHDVTELKVA